MNIPIITRLEALSAILLSRTYGLLPTEDAPMSIGEMRQLLLYTDALRAVAANADALTTMEWPMLFTSEGDEKDEFFDVLEELEVSLEHLYGG
jgi:hypothetical protein